jgi:hypothetical protein
MTLSSKLKVKVKVKVKVNLSLRCTRIKLKLMQEDARRLIIRSCAEACKLGLGYQVN